MSAPKRGSQVTMLEGSDHPAQAFQAIRCTSEMGITHAEFFRGLSAAIAGRPYALQHDEVWITEGRRRVVITLSPQEERVLGALRIPVSHITWAFTGYTRQEVEAFMRTFKCHFQRGGG